VDDIEIPLDNNLNTLEDFQVKSRGLIVVTV
jgi:hypothetical protein